VEELKSVHAESENCGAGEVEEVKLEGCLGNIFRSDSGERSCNRCRGGKIS
jgi:hypothetical protein